MSGSREVKANGVLETACRRLLVPPGPESVPAAAGNKEDMVSASDQTEDRESCAWETGTWGQAGLQVRTEARYCLLKRGG